MERIYLLFVAGLLSISITLGSENNLVTGKVVDLTTNRGISNVNLFIPKQNIGTATKEDGSFTLEILPNIKAILLVSHVAYVTKKIPLDGKSEELKIGLKEILFQAEDIVVTGTRTNQLYKNAPIATEVITKKEIENSGVNNVKELLLTRSGININPSVYGGSEINFLGMDSRNILILIDGQPIIGKFYDRVSLDHIPTSNIDQIELTKGPSSSLYGSEAMAGVINIITNTDINNNAINFSMHFSSPEETIKSNNLKDGIVKYNVSIQKKLTPLLLSINTNLEQISKDKIIKESDIDDITKYSLNAALKWEFNQINTIKISNRFYQHVEEGKSPLIKTLTTIKRNNVSIDHSLDIKDNWILNHMFQRQTYNRNYTETWNIGPEVGTIETDDLATEYLDEYEVTLSKKINLNNFNVGMETSSGSYKSNRIGINKQHINSNSIFAQYETHILNDYNVIMGLRIDKYSDYQHVYSPRIGFMYSHDKYWKFRTSWGKGFRTPSFMERFIDYDHSATFGYKVIGNDDLKAEQSNGITAGVEYFHPTIYQASLMLYYTEFVNHIAEYYINDISFGEAKYSYHNINNTYRGLEIRGKWKASSKLSASWEINLIDNRYNDGTMIPNTQPISVVNRLSYQAPKYPLGISTNIKWTGPYTPSFHDIVTGNWVKEEKGRSGYTIFDISGNYTLKNYIKINCGIKNVSNFIDHNYGPFIGRSFYFEISAHLMGRE